MQNPRTLLIIIATLFAAPLLLAVLMRSSWWDFKPSELSNRGILVQPPVALDLGELVPVAEADIQGSARPWQVLLLVGDRCPEDCRQALVGVRQVHLASGKHRDDVGLVVVSRLLPEPSTVAEIREIYTEFHVLHDANGALSRALAVIAEQGDDTGPKTSHWRAQALVLDPAAHIILRYEPGFDPKDLAEDLDRLLTWSRQ